MNELREKIRQQYLRGAQYGELRANRGNDPLYVPDPIEYESKAIYAILDAVIAALPGEDRAIDVASDEDERYAFHTAKNAYMSAIEETKSLLQAAKENK